jgi:NAD(P)H-hydrate epimerase
MIEIKEIPYLTTDQMVEVDRLMEEEYGIHLIQMMENAGRHLAQLARNRFLKGNANGKHVVVLAGSGGNGGGAMVCARHLHNWGAEVTVVLSRGVKDLAGTIKHQGEILQRMGVEIGEIEDIKEKPQWDLIVDGIIGYSLQGAPRGKAAEMIRWANEQNTPILALDLPSGLNVSTGEVLEPTIRAAVTMTLALPKEGLRRAEKNVVGELYLADIGVPPELYALAPLNMDIGPLFAKKQILRLG